MGPNRAPPQVIVVGVTPATYLASILAHVRRQLRTALTCRQQPRLVSQKTPRTHLRGGWDQTEVAGRQQLRTALPSGLLTKHEIESELVKTRKRMTQRAPTAPKAPWSLEIPSWKGLRLVSVQH